jgi:uncharacterized OB-fold protein
MIEKFGTVSFTKTTRVNDFIDHLENGKVMYTHCKTCGADFFPPRAIARDALKVKWSGAR